MKRRKFLGTTALGIGGATLIPTSLFANQPQTSFLSLHQGFNLVSEKIRETSISTLSAKWKTAYLTLSQKLNKDNYQFDSTRLVKLTEYCYALPLIKSSMIGFQSQELALLIKNDKGIEHCILDEKTSKGLDKLAKNFIQSIQSHNLNIEPLEFVTPKKIIKIASGKKSIFKYQNKGGNHIELTNLTDNQIANIS